MFAKVATVFGLFAVAAQVAVAAPPACLIAGVNTQDDPSDIKTVCTSGASEVQKYMSSNCGNALDDATSAWASYCKDAGVTVSSSISSSATSASHTASSTGSHTGSATSATSGTQASTTSSASGSMGTGATTASSGFLTATTNPGGLAASSLATASASGASGASGASSTTHSPTSTATIITSTGAASRLGMDLVGLAAVGFFGAIVAM